jgi:hypothetical protein
LKPATDNPATPQAIKTTTLREIVAAPGSGERATPELWQYLESLHGKDESEWNRHLIYIYRVEPTPSVPIAKCGKLLTLPDGSQVQISDKEELEFALMRHFGGRVFRIIVKRGSERITQDRVYIDAPPRPVTVHPDMPGAGTVNSGSATVAGMSDSAQIAGKAIDTIAGQEHQAVNLGLSMMNTAAQVVRNFAQPSTPAAPAPPNETDQMFRMLMLRMMEKMLDRFDAPPTVAPTEGTNSLTEKILGVAVDRMLNPAPAGAPVSIGAEIARQIPQLGSTIADGLREFRLAREAELQMMQLSRTAAPGQPQVLPPQNAAPATANPATGVPGAPSMDFIDHKILEILQQPVSADQAADDAMTFLAALDAKAVHQLFLLGEGGMLALFQTRPILKAATSNMPRLVEFIRAFLKMHAEDQAAESGSAASAKGPALPN